MVENTSASSSWTPVRWPSVSSSMEKKQHLLPFPTGRLLLSLDCVCVLGCIFQLYTFHRDAMEMETHRQRQIIADLWVALWCALVLSTSSLLQLYVAGWFCTGADYSCLQAFTQKAGSAHSVVKLALSLVLLCELDVWVLRRPSLDGILVLSLPEDENEYTITQLTLFQLLFLTHAVPRIALALLGLCNGDGEAREVDGDAGEEYGYARTAADSSDEEAGPCSFGVVQCV
ncbi:unnamed protein product [Amoebophrya sp. A25]|nr:unnamed protein product [Amoebophrya sp. A25]|eukprot:GSA25T00006453001.1